jgi:hypothetical protein
MESFLKNLNKKKDEVLNQNTNKHLLKQKKD